MHCSGFAPAEMLACTACLRLGAPFVPLPALISLPSSCDDNWSELFHEIKPIAAIITSSECSDLAESLRKRGVHRLLQLLPDGSLTSSESEWTPSLPDISTISMPHYHCSLSCDFAGARESGEPAHHNCKSSCEATPPLYVLFTSGSTTNGNSQKGVVGTQLGLLNRLSWQFRRFPFTLESNAWNEPGLTERCSIACRRTPLTFVDSMVEMFGPILAGVALYAPPVSVLKRGDMLRLAVLASRNHVTRCTMLPSQLDQLCAFLRNDINRNLFRNENGIYSCWSTLRWMFVSGEVCSPYIVKSFYEEKCENEKSNEIKSVRLIGCDASTLINLYGSTEVAGDICCAQLSQHECADSVPVGVEIIPENYLYVAARRSEVAIGDNESSEYQLVDDGEEGELLIGGIQVCRGYLGNANGAETFIKNPFLHEAKERSLSCASIETKAYVPYVPDILFCSGDIVRVVKEPFGRVLYFVRRDDINSQTLFKIRGGQSVCVAFQERILEDYLRNFICRRSSDENATLSRSFCLQKTVMVTVATLSATSASNSSDHNILVSCIHSNLLKSIKIDCNTCTLLASDVCRTKETPGESLYSFLLHESTEEHGGQIIWKQARLLTFVLRQTLLLAASTEGNDELHSTHMILPTFFIPVDSFSLYCRSGKLNRHSFCKQVQDWIDEEGFTRDVDESVALSSSRPDEGLAIKRKICCDECAPFYNSDEYQSYCKLVIDVIVRVLPLVDLLIAISATSPSSSMSFYALGGDSMSAIEASWLIATRLNEKTCHLPLEYIHDLLFKPIHVVIDNIYTKVNGIANDKRSNNVKLLSNAECTIDPARKNSSFNEGGSRRSYFQISIDDKFDEMTPPQFEWFGKAGSNLESTLSNNRKMKCCPNDSEDVQKKCDGKVPLKFSKLWRCSFSKCIDASPLLVTPSYCSNCSDFMEKGFLFVGSHNGEVCCIDKLSGEKKWQCFLGSQQHVEGGIIYDPFLWPRYDKEKHISSEERSLPCGVVFAASYFGQDVDVTSEAKAGDTSISARGRVWAINASTGDVLWHTGNTISGEVKGSPVVVRLKPTPSSSAFEKGDGHCQKKVRLCNLATVLCVGSHDGSLYVFDPRDGTLLNSLDLHKGSIFSTPVPIGTCDDDGCCDFVIDGFKYYDSLIVTTTRGWIISISMKIYRMCLSQNSSTSASIWNVQLSVLWSCSSSAFSPIFTTPSVCINSRRVNHSCSRNCMMKCVVCCTVGGECMCIGTSTGELLWSLQCAASMSLSTGEGRNKSSPVFSSPCVFPILRSAIPVTEETAHGAREVLDDVGIAFGCHDGFVRIVSLQLGRVIWSVDLQCAIYSSPAFIHSSLTSSIDVSIGLVSTTAGRLFALSVPHCYDESDSECRVRILDRVVLPGEVYSSPVFTERPRQDEYCPFSAYLAIGCRDDSVYAFELS